MNGEAQLIGKNGKAIVFGGAPNLGFSIARGDSPFNPLTLVEGSWPKANEVVIDKSTAGKEHFEVGQIVGVQAEGPVQLLRISGHRQVRLGRDDRGRDARRLRPADRAAPVRQAGQARRDRGRREAGRVRPELVQEIRAILPPGTQVRSGAAQAHEDAEGTNSFISFLQASCSRSAGSRSSSAAS